MVTHELDIARYTKRNIVMRDGKIVSDERRERTLESRPRLNCAVCAKHNRPINFSTMRILATLRMAAPRAAPEQNAHRAHDARHHFRRRRGHRARSASATAPSPRSKARSPASARMSFWSLSGSFTSGGVAQRLGQRGHADASTTRMPSSAKFPASSPSAPKCAAARRSPPANRIGSPRSWANPPTISTSALAVCRGRHVQRSGCAHRGQGRRHRQDRRDAALRRRRSARQSHPHQECAVHRRRACWCPRDFHVHGPGPGRCHHHPLHQRDEARARRHDFAHASMSRPPAPAMLAPVAAANHRSAAATHIASRRAKTTTSPSASSRKSPTPPRPPRRIS